MSGWGGTVTAAPAGAVIICAASGYQRRRFELCSDFCGNRLRRSVHRHGDGILWLLQIRELAGKDGFRSEMALARAQAAKNEFIAALEINELNRSGAKLIAITAFEGRASQNCILFRGT